MPDGMYNVLALLPESSDFTIPAAVAHFDQRRQGRTLLRAEPAVADAASRPTGFRVFFGGWAVVGWLDDGPSVRTDSEDLATEAGLPGPAEVIAGCSRCLSIWSDADPTGDHSDDMTALGDQLRERFGAFVYDPVNGGWWT
jgi:hypothetical protein